MHEINWDRLLADEDRLIGNSDRKYRHHFKSIESMSEELVHKESTTFIHESETVSDDDFGTVKNAKLRKALLNLKPKYRTVIRLYYWQGLSQAEIAEMLGYSQRNISYILSAAYEKIASSLSE